nr:MAG: polyprotein [Halichoeres marginatus picornavirus]
MYKNQTFVSTLPLDCPKELDRILHGERCPKHSFVNCARMFKVCECIGSDHWKRGVVLKRCLTTVFGDVSNEVQKEKKEEVIRHGVTNSTMNLYGDGNTVTTSQTTSTSVPVTMPLKSDTDAGGISKSIAPPSAPHWKAKANPGTNIADGTVVTETAGNVIDVASAAAGHEDDVFSNMGGESTYAVEDPEAPQASVHRMFKGPQIEFSVSDPRWKVLMCKDLTSILTGSGADNLFTRNLAQHRICSFGASVKLVINANQFMGGSLIMYAFPEATSVVADRLDFPETSMMCPRKILNLRDRTEVKMTLPFVSQNPKMQIGAATNWTIVVAVYSPLTAPAGNPQTLSGTVYVTPKDVRLQGLSYSLPTPIGMNAQGFVDGPAALAVMDDEDEVDEDVENVTRQGNVRQVQVSGGFVSSNVLAGQSLPLDVSGAGAPSCDYMPGEVTDMVEMMKEPCYMAQVAWGVSDAAGTMLAQWAVGPLENGFSRTTLNLATQFAQWRGGIDFSFLFTGSRQHFGRVGLCFVPYDSEPPRTQEQAELGTWMVVDIGNKSEVSFRCPYLLAEPWVPTHGGLIGNLSMWVIDPLVNASTSATSVEFCVTASAGADFEVRKLTTGRTRQGEDGVEIASTGDVAEPSDHPGIPQSQHHGEPQVPTVSKLSSFFAVYRDLYRGDRVVTGGTPREFVLAPHGIQPDFYYPAAGSPDLEWMLRMFAYYKCDLSLRLIAKSGGNVSGTYKVYYLPPGAVWNSAEQEAAVWCEAYHRLDVDTVVYLDIPYGSTSAVIPTSWRGRKSVKTGDLPLERTDGAGFGSIWIVSSQAVKLSFSVALNNFRAWIPVSIPTSFVAPTQTQDLPPLPISFDEYAVRHGDDECVYVEDLLSLTDEHDVWIGRVQRFGYVHWQVQCGPRAISLSRRGMCAYIALEEPTEERYVQVSPLAWHNAVMLLGEEFKGYGATNNCTHFVTRVTGVDIPNTGTFLLTGLALLGGACAVGALASRHGLLDMNVSVGGVSAQDMQQAIYNVPIQLNEAAQTLQASAVLVGGSVPVLAQSVTQAATAATSFTEVIPSIVQAVSQAADAANNSAAAVNRVAGIVDGVSSGEGVMSCAKNACVRVCVKLLRLVSCCVIVFSAPSPGTIAGVLGILLAEALEFGLPSFSGVSGILSSLFSVNVSREEVRSIFYDLESDPETVQLLEPDEEGVVFFDSRGGQKAKEKKKNRVDPKAPNLHPVQRSEAPLFESSDSESDEAVRHAGGAVQSFNQGILALKNAEWLVDKAFALIEKIVKLVTGKVEVDPRKLLEDSIGRMDEVRQWISDSFVASKPPSLSDISANKRKVKSWREEASKLTGPNPYIVTLNQMMTSLVELETRTKKSVASSRPQPVVVYLWGTSGTGKSTVTNLLTTGYCRARGLDHGSSVYAKPPGTDFFDGYTGQPVMILDDLGQDPDGKDWSNFAAMVSPTPFRVPMANLNEKGILFTSELLIITSNDSRVTSNAMRCPEAVARRLTIKGTIVPDPTYRLPSGAFDYGRAIKAKCSHPPPRGFKACHPLLCGSALKFEPRDSNMSLNKGKTVQKTVVQLLADILSAVDKHNQFNDFTSTICYQGECACTGACNCDEWSLEAKQREYGPPPEYSMVAPQEFLPECDKCDCSTCMCDVRRVAREKGVCENCFGPGHCAKDCAVPSDRAFEALARYEQVLYGPARYRNVTPWNPERDYLRSPWYVRAFETVKQSTFWWLPVLTILGTICSIVSGVLLVRKLSANKEEKETSAQGPYSSTAKWRSKAKVQRHGNDVVLDRIDQACYPVCGGESTLTAVNLYDRFYTTPTHLWEGYGPNPRLESITLRGAMLTREDIVWQEGDITVVRHPTAAPGKDLRRYLTDNPADHIGSPARLLCHSGKRAAVVLATSLTMQSKLHLGDEVETGLIKYQGACFPGMCGSPLISCEPSGYKLLGFHIAGVAGVTGFSKTLSRSRCGFAERQGIRRVVGSLDTPVFVNRKTRLTPSGAMGAFEVKKEPAALTDKDGRLNEGVTLDSVMFNKFTGDVNTPWPNLEAAADLYLSRALFGWEHKTLTLTEAVNGWQAMDGLDMSQSSGYPWCTRGVNRKSLFMENSEGQFIPTMELQRAIEATMEDTRYLPFVTFLKDELRPVEKVRSGKTRLVDCSPLPHAILMRSYWGSLYSWYHTNNGTRLGSAVGCDPDVDWTRFAWSFAHLDEVWDLDYSCFDGTIPTVIYDVVADWFAARGVPEPAVRLLRDLKCTRRVYGSEVAEVDGTMASGVSGTSIFNSMFNNIFVLSACMSHPDFNPDVFTCLAYGDDVLYGHVPTIHPSFVKDFYDKYTPLVVTPASKSGNFPTTSTLQDVTFLKRRFVQDTRRPCWYHPVMEPDTYEQSVMWSRGGDFQDTLTSLSYLAWHAGREPYERWCARVNQALEENGHYAREFLPYSYLRAVWETKLDSY